eukprot:1393375-Amorphochlora_amoeboformis.AAC.2
MACVLSFLIWNLGRRFRRGEIVPSQELHGTDPLFGKHLGTWNFDHIRTWHMYLGIQGKEFTEGYVSTIGVDFEMKQTTIQGKKVGIQYIASKLGWLHGDMLISHVHATI